MFSFIPHCIEGLSAMCYTDMLVFWLLWFDEVLTNILNAYVTNCQTSFWKVHLTLFILVYFPMLVDRINMELPVLYFKGHRSRFLKYDSFLSLKDLFLSLQTVQTLMKCRIMRHFIGVFTIRQSTCLHVPRLKKAKA